MNTSSHLIWTYIVFRKRVNIGYGLIAAVVPDMAYILYFIYLFIQNDFTIQYQLFNETYNGRITKAMSSSLHSIVVFGIAALILTHLKLTEYYIVLYSWLFHIILDVLTHIEDANPLFYPLSDRVIPGVVSYWNPEYWGMEFAIVNYLLMFAFLAYFAYGWYREKKWVAPKL